MNKYRMIKKGSRHRITVYVNTDDTRFVMQFVAALMDMGYTQVGYLRYVWNVVFGK